MSGDTDRVLASIDEAIDGYVRDDWAVSGDAMRWQPDAPETQQHSGGDGEWNTLGVLADRGFVRRVSNLSNHMEVARRFDAQITGSVRVNMAAVTQAFAALAHAMKPVVAAFAEVAKKNHPQVARLQYGDDYRRHRRACRLCNPAGNPKPLKVNGADYRRRTRARRRKNRG
jgi:hypothetical protein